MIFILPFIFGAIGVAVGAVAGAFTAHAAGEKDRQAAKHHRQVANELTDKYVSLEKKYYDFADKSKKQIDDLTRQNALSEIEKDCLRLAVRLQQNVIYLMWEIDREPTADALNRFLAAVEQTNQVLGQLKEELIIVPDDYYERLTTAIIDSQERGNNNELTLTANKTLSVTEEENDEVSTKTVHIKVIGIGWDGINAINHMMYAHIPGVDFWCNMVGNESRDEIAEVLEEAELIFIIYSIGDDISVGAASLVAKLAKEMGIITIGVVVNRSFFDSQIEPLKSLVDTLIIIPRDRYWSITPEQNSAPEAYYDCDRFIYYLLRQVVQSISELINNPGLINPNFADVCTVIKDRGSALIGASVISGKFRAIKAAKAAISSPFLESSIEEAQGIIFHISGGSDITLNEVNAAVETINQVVAANVKIVFGATIDDTLENQVRITVIATGVKYLGRYKELRRLLAAGKWEEADNETANIIFKLSGQKYAMSSVYSKTVPFTEFNTIDKLWNEYSNGHFGFSVQKRIWQEEYSKLGEFDTNKIYARFCETVGWRVINGCLLSSYLDFSLNAPVGHLPVKVAGQGWRAASFLGSIYEDEQEELDTLGIYENLKNLLEKVEDIGIYQRLKRLLAAGKWREANHETRRVMLKLNGRIKEGDFTKEYEEDCRYLYIIDRLWVIYSEGRFGFSVQEKIWQEVHKDFQEFGTCVGWGFKRRKDYFWVSYHKLNFTLDAPEGHLPAVFPLLNQYRGFDEQNVFSILSKFEFI
jgi:cell division GTPase FtsZ/gas vesicle protein